MKITYAIFSGETLASKFLFSALLGCRVFFFLHQMEDEKGKDEGGGNSGRALTVWESGWCTTLVVVLNLLRHISFMTEYRR